MGDFNITQSSGMASMDIQANFKERLGGAPDELSRDDFKGITFRGADGVTAKTDDIYARMKSVREKYGLGPYEKDQQVLAIALQDIANAHGGLTIKIEKNGAVVKIPPENLGVKNADYAVKFSKQFSISFNWKGRTTTHTLVGEDLKNSLIAFAKKEGMPIKNHSDVLKVLSKWADKNEFENLKITRINIKELGDVAGTDKKKTEEDYNYFVKACLAINEWRESLHMPTIKIDTRTAGDRMQEGVDKYWGK